MESEPAALEKKMCEGAIFFLLGAVVILHGFCSFVGHRDAEHERPLAFFDMAAKFFPLIESSQRAWLRPSR